jgi:transcription-repair coupling factor (superfamily II helicase)
VNNISERLQLYTQTDRLKDEEALQKFRGSLADRFGPLPRPVEDLLKTVQLRWLAQKLGFEKMILKNGNLKGYFVNKDFYFQSDVFGKIICFATKNPKLCRLKENPKGPILLMDQVPDVDRAIRLLGEMEK